MIGIVRGEPDRGYPFAVAGLALALAILGYVAVIGAYTVRSGASSLERGSEGPGRVERSETATTTRTPLLLFSIPAVIAALPLVVNRTRLRRPARIVAAGLLVLLVLLAPFTLFFYVPVVGAIALSAILGSGP
jgi:hypothetical protein